MTTPGSALRHAGAARGRNGAPRGYRGGGGTPDRRRHGERRSDRVRGASRPRGSVRPSSAGGSGPCDATASTSGSSSIGARGSSVHFGMAGGLHTSRARGACGSCRAGGAPRPRGRPGSPSSTCASTTVASSRSPTGAVSAASAFDTIRRRSRRSRRSASTLFAECPAPPGFARSREAARLPVKALLLDQSFAAGVGNWIADEVLYQARIAPRRAAALAVRPGAGPARAGASARSSGAAVAVGSDSERYPPAWLFHRRWDAQARASLCGATRSAGRRSRAAPPPGCPPSSADPWLRAVGNLRDGSTSRGTSLAPSAAPGACSRSTARHS